MTHTTRTSASGGGGLPPTHEKASRTDSASVEVTVVLLVACYIMSCGVKQMHTWCTEQIEALDLFGWWYGIKAETGGTFLRTLPTTIFMYFFLFLMIRYANVRNTVFHVVNKIVQKLTSTVWNRV